jgi:hypothetical protein
MGVQVILALFFPQGGPEARKTNYEWISVSVASQKKNDNKSEKDFINLVRSTTPYL